MIDTVVEPMLCDEYRRWERTRQIRKDLAECFYATCRGGDYYYAVGFAAGYSRNAGQRGTVGEGYRSKSDAGTVAYQMFQLTTANLLPQEQSVRWGLSHGFEKKTR